jgi:glutamyl-tRNA reductase
VSLQAQAEEMRQAELHRFHARLSTFSEEQIAAVEALTRGLVNKFLHPPMTALKQAAREGDSARLDALCDTWALPASVVPETEPEASAPASGATISVSEKTKDVKMTEATMESRR